MNWNIKTYTKVANLMKAAERQEQLTAVSGEQVNFAATLNNLREHGAGSGCYSCKQKYISEYLTGSTIQDLVIIIIVCMITWR